MYFLVLACLLYVLYTSVFLDLIVVVAPAEEYKLLSSLCSFLQPHAIFLLYCPNVPLSSLLKRKVWICVLPVVLETRYYKSAHENVFTVMFTYEYLCSSRGDGVRTDS
jgi:hypothetical protein